MLITAQSIKDKVHYFLSSRALQTTSVLTAFAYATCFFVVPPQSSAGYALGMTGLGIATAASLCSTLKPLNPGGWIWNPYIYSEVSSYIKGVELKMFSPPCLCSEYDPRRFLAGGLLIGEAFIKTAECMLFNDNSILRMTASPVLAIIRIVGLAFPKTNAMGLIAFGLLEAPLQALSYYYMSNSSETANSKPNEVLQISNGFFIASAVIAVVSGCLAARWDTQQQRAPYSPVS